MATPDQLAEYEKDCDAVAGMTKVIMEGLQGKPVHEVGRIFFLLAAQALDLAMQARPTDASEAEVFETFKHTWRKLRRYRIEELKKRGQS